jgi:hypothetical protein
MVGEESKRLNSVAVKGLNVSVSTLIFHSLSMTKHDFYMLLQAQLNVLSGNQICLPAFPLFFALSSCSSFCMISFLICSHLDLGLPVMHAFSKCVLF